MNDSPLTFPLIIGIEALGPQDPPDHPWIYNKKDENGEYPPIEDFFMKAAKSIEEFTDEEIRILELACEEENDPNTYPELYK